MTIESIQVYYPDGPWVDIIEFDVPEDESSHDKVREFQGFRKKDVLQSYFQDLTNPPIDCNVYERTTDFGHKEYIFEIWGRSEQIACFFCKNELSFFHLLERYTTIRNNHMYYELMVFNKQKDDD